MKRMFFLCIIAMIGCDKQTTQDDPHHQNILNVVNKTQEIVSVQKGQQIDTASLRTLFLPSARFTVIGEEDGKKSYETVNLDDFLASLTDEYYSNGYQEKGKGQVIETYNGIAHAMQSFHGKDSEGEEGWGVNSYQLIDTGDGWKIVNMVWTMSSDGKEGIPERYLKD